MIYSPHSCVFNPYLSIISGLFLHELQTFLPLKSLTKSEDLQDHNQGRRGEERGGVLSAEVSRPTAPPLPH